MAGTLELADGDRERAVASWRRSLELSHTYRKTIREHARGTLTDEQRLDEILPLCPSKSTLRRWISTPSPTTRDVGCFTRWI